MKGVRGLIKKSFCTAVTDTRDLWCALCRLVWVVTFWWEEVLSVGIHAYKCGFRGGFAFVCSFVRIS